MKKLGKQEPLGEGYYQPGCQKIRSEEKDIGPDSIYQGQAIVLLGYLDWESEDKAEVYHKY